MWFWSTYENKIDSKGRVSVPASYRSVLASQREQLMVTTGLKHPCLEGQGASRLIQVIQHKENLDVYSEEAELLETLITNAREMSLDSEGRILLHEEFIAHAELKDKVLFTGAGSLFRLWNPEVWQKREAENKKHIKAKGLPKLVLNPPPTEPDKGDG